MKFFFLWGCLLWAVATAIFRVAGQFFLTPDNAILLMITFILLVPLIAMTTYPVYQWKNAHDDRLLAAISIALPGMILDIFSISFFTDVFPNLQEEAGVHFAAGLLWAYSLILLTGIFPKNR